MDAFNKHVGGNQDAFITAINNGRVVTDPRKGSGVFK
jgi:hypothetical protein